MTNVCVMQDVCCIFGLLHTAHVAVQFLRRSLHAHLQVIDDLHNSSVRNINIQGLTEMQRTQSFHF